MTRIIYGIFISEEKEHKIFLHCLHVINVEDVNRGLQGLIFSLAAFIFCKCVINPVTLES